MEYTQPPAIVQIVETPYYATNAPSALERLAVASNAISSGTGKIKSYDKIWNTLRELRPVHVTKVFTDLEKGVKKHYTLGLSGDEQEPMVGLFYVTEPTQLRLDKAVYLRPGQNALVIHYKRNLNHKGDLKIPDWRNAKNGKFEAELRRVFKRYKDSKKKKPIGRPPERII